MQCRPQAEMMAAQLAFHDTMLRKAKSTIAVCTHHLLFGIAQGRQAL